MTDNHRMPGSLGESDIVILPFIGVRKRCGAIFHTSLFSIFQVCVDAVCADLKEVYLSCTLLVLNILMKYNLELQRNILGTAAPSSTPPAFSTLLASPSGL